MSVTYSKGLEGVIADESSICLVDGQNGRLFYRGQSIDDIAEAKSFDEICYLLLYGALPSDEQLKSYRELLAANYELPTHAKKVIESLPREQHPMEALMSVLPLIGQTLPKDIVTERIEKDGEKQTQVAELDRVRNEAIAILAKLPTIIAHFQRHRTEQAIIAPNSELDLLTNFLTMFQGERPTERDVEIFSICEVLQMEHGFNASTFTARVVASTLSPLHASLAAAVGALYGKLHGGADEAAFTMAKEAIGSPDRAESYVDDLLSRGGKIMGLGHRVYRTMDPRARILKRLALELNEAKGGQKKAILETLTKVEEVMAARMAAKGKEIHPNVEFYKGPVFNALDIPTDQFTAMFVLARSFGWCAHILELWQDHRIYRPRAMYVGPDAT